MVEPAVVLKVGNGAPDFCLPDKDRRIAEIWRNVKVEGHVEAVKRRLVELQAA